jgi:hypothetical protein
MTGILRPLEGFEHVLRYESHTGKFFWLIDRPRKTKAGDEAGHINSTGYVKFDTITELTRRIALLGICTQSKTPAACK